ncbi:transmembrane protein 92 [Meriones unguiculatus]|uniref:transmembrane protein 92 n=1 Tax=Meriones unguiculatus TaxID=10047 RepID=UPI000B4FBEBA|nr:transmembrane protein 92 [Meriones unguiculatus]
MSDAWVSGLLTLALFFSLQPSLQRVSAEELLVRCHFLNCPRGFVCCESRCCMEKSMWDLADDPFRILFIIFLVMVPLLCICGLVKRFCHKCRKPEQNHRMDQQMPPEPSSLDAIWVTTLDPPPPYSQVVLKSIPTEPPPPYSLRPEGLADQMRETTQPVELPHPQTS